ncbi:MAG: hypothetical protein ACXVPL_10165 [Actinomycetota bacterium]
MVGAAHSRWWIQRPVAAFVGAIVLAILAVVPALAASTSPSVTPSPTPSPSPTPATLSPGPQPGGAGDQVVLLGRVDVPRGASVGEVVVFSGRADIAGVVRGDLIVASGPISISGQVSGSVVALNGSIHLFPTAQVGGDVLARDEIAYDAGADVAGSVRQDVRFTFSRPLRALGAFVSWLAVAVSMLILGLAFAFLAPRVLARTGVAARYAPWSSAGWGLALAALIPILAVGAIATVAGLALGLAALLALALLAMTGAMVTAHAVGRALVGEARHPATAYLAGWGIATVVGLVPVVSGIVFALSAVFGLGATAVAVWRARDPERGGRHRAGLTASAPKDGADAWNL